MNTATEVIANVHTAVGVSRSATGVTSRSKGAASALMASHGKRTSGSSDRCSAGVATAFRRPCLGRRVRRERGDLSRDVFGVMLDPAEQRRSPGVLPWQAEEVEAGYGCDAALMHDPALTFEHGEVDPGVVKRESGCPDDGVD